MQVTLDLRGPETFDTTPRKGFSLGGTYASVLPEVIRAARRMKYNYIKQATIYSEMQEMSRDSNKTTKKNLI